MAITYEAIATVTVGSGGAATMAFSSIPATYTDLVVKVSARDTRSFISDNGQIRFNGDTNNANYSSRRLYTDTSSIASDSPSDNTWFMSADTATSNTFGSAEFYIPNYAGSNYKSVSIESTAESNDSNDVYRNLSAYLWSNTAAITTITLYPSAFNFKEYSTATLYGIKNS